MSMHSLIRFSWYAARACAVSSANSLPGADSFFNVAVSIGCALTRTLIQCLIARAIPLGNIGFTSPTGLRDSIAQLRTQDDLKAAGFWTPRCPNKTLWDTPLEPHPQTSRIWIRPLQEAGSSRHAKQIHRQTYVLRITQVAARSPQTWWMDSTILKPAQVPLT